MSEQLAVQEQLPVPEVSQRDLYDQQIQQMRDMMREHRLRATGEYDSVQNPSVLGSGAVRHSADISSSDRWSQLKLSFDVGQDYC